MKKEMKKLLLVAVSVGLFLVVIIGAAILILTPKVQTDEPAFSSSRPIPAGQVQPSNADPSQMLKDSDSIMGIQPLPVADAQETIAPIEGDTRDGDRLTINIPRPSTAAVPNTPAASAPRPAAAATPAQSAEKPAAQTKPAPAAKPATPAAATKARNDYWVQTGAFTAMVRAENAKETLASKGITSIIENRQLEGQTWYRVRLGPYTSETEANYWLALVKSIDGFAESQIRQTPSMR